MNNIKNNMQKAKELVAQMTLEEKAGMCSGQDYWHTKSVERLGIPSIMMVDGPHGLRKQVGESDHLGINQSIASTCFPTAVTIASSFDRELLYEFGVALSEECLENEVAVILGPGANIKRNPLCGRNFEYFSEDPFVTGEMATAFIKGVQSKNIGVSMKHFYANSQEKARMSSDSVVDERTLREIYLPAFEKAVKEEQPATLMCAYNKINGTYASDNKEAMTSIPRDDWGFDGLIVTDWGAMNDRVEGIKAGLDLEMPSSNGLNDAKIVEAVKNGTLKEEEVDKCAERIISLVLATKDNKIAQFDRDNHNEFARKVARESGVLLKNDGILPLNKKDKVLIVGEFAENPRFQGAGSSKVNAIKITSLLDELKFQNIDFDYAKGYDLQNNEPNEILISKACEMAKNTDKVVCLVGLPDASESEGFDRQHLNLPNSHNKLIDELKKANENIAVVLHLGSPVLMPWKDDVKAILNMYLGGQNVGGATFDLLFGITNPCGKLAETFPLALEDVASNKWFSTNSKIVPYPETIYVGYRYYDKAEKAVAYPFGHGLSYTTFKYSDLKIANKVVSFKVKNMGKFEGKEVAQIYVAPPKSEIYKAKKELKGYEKVELKAGEEKTVEIKLNERSFAYWNVNIHDWHIESGNYGIEVGSSSQDIRLRGEAQVKGNGDVKVPNYKASAPTYYNLPKGKFDVSMSEYESVLGRKLPKAKIKKPFTEFNTIGDLRASLGGRIVVKALKEKMKGMYNDTDNKDKKLMAEAMILDFPIRALYGLSRGAIPPIVFEGMLDLANGHFIKGIKKLKQLKNNLN